MSGTPKRSGACCPKPSCLDRCPAEYAQRGQEPQWACHKCGASGPLLGEFDGRKPAEKTASAPQVKKHWSQP
jgi:hypothetical protein